MSLQRIESVPDSLIKSPYYVKKAGSLREEKLPCLWFYGISSRNAEMQTKKWRMPPTERKGLGNVEIENMVSKYIICIFLDEL